MTVKTNSVAIVSGGLDSTVLVHQMISEGYVPHLLSFDYGQRHSKELAYAKITAKRLELPHDIIDLTGITHLISNSALTAGAAVPDQEGQVMTQFKLEVPEGHYAKESMKATVVPNRNMIMISIAAGIAVNEKAKTIGVGVHGGDHFIYPDCRPKFIFAAGQAILTGNEGFHDFFTSTEPVELDALGVRKTYFPALPIFTPFLEKSKADIAYRGIQLGVPFHLTWSCYKGGDKHCGKCGTCVERLEAIAEAEMRWTTYMGSVGVAHITKYDQTEYEDNEFWKATVREGGKVVDPSDFH